MGGISVLLAALMSPPGLAGQEMDQAIFHFSQLEAQLADADGTRVGLWEAGGWIGKDHDRLWWFTEGEYFNDRLAESEVTLLYGRYVRRFWDLVVGYRQEFEPESTGFLTVGIMGLAPYWFEVGAFGHLSTEGIPSIRVEAENDLYLTQRWVLQPMIEVDALLSEDQKNGLSAGFSSLEVGFRSRYEIRRKFAPYLDATWAKEYGHEDDGGPPPGSGWRFGGGLRLIY